MFLYGCRTYTICQTVCFSQRSRVFFLIYFINRACPLTFWNLSLLTLEAFHATLILNRKGRHKFDKLDFKLDKALTITLA